MSQVVRFNGLSALPKTFCISSLVPPVVSVVFLNIEYTELNNEQKRVTEICGKSE